MLSPVSRILKRILFNAFLTFLGHSAVAQNPVIFSTDRRTASMGEIVTLHGSDFGTDPARVRVMFGGTKASIKSISNQLLEVRTPSGSTFDAISVTNTTSGLTATAPGQFFLNYRGEGGITPASFSQQFDFQAQSGLYDLCLCDLNDDSKPDVATASNNSNQITIFQNISSPGSVNFSAQNVLINARTLHVRCGDLNGDGRPDLVFSEGSDGARIFILTNNGNFNFSLQSVTLTGLKVKQVAIADLDLDGRPDVVVTNTGGNLLTILPNTSRTSVSFAAPLNITISQASSTDALAIGDLDGDGYPEIATSQYQADNENKVFILRNQGSFSFDQSKILAVNKAVSCIRIADLDADTKPDLAIARLTGSDISVYLNNSAGELSFRNPLFFVTETLPVGMDFGDFDGDDKLDIAVGSIAKSVSVLNNTTQTPGTATLAPVVKLSSTYTNRNLRNADVDGDGKPDIVFTSVDDFSGVPTPSSKISVLRNLSCMVPRITPGGSLDICSGTTLQLKATSGGGVTYQWYREGTPAPLKSGQEDFLDVTTPGAYKVIALAGPPSCSKESAVVQVTFTTPASAPSQTALDARSNSPVCTDNTLMLQVNDVGATEYRWRGPDGFLQTVSTATLERPGFNLTRAGLYIVEMISGTCVARVDSTLVEIVSVPDFAISYAGSTGFCAGITKTLQVSPALTSGFSYQWFERSVGLISEATFDNYTTGASGEYYAIITPDDAGCVPRETQSVRLVSLARPTASFQLAESACVGEKITFTQLSSGDGSIPMTYLWSFGDGQSSDDASPEKAYGQQNVFQVELKVAYEGVEECDATASRTVEIFGATKPEITASATSLCAGDAITLSVAAGFSEVAWSTDESDYEITVTSPGTYHVETRDTEGCQSADEIVISEKEVPVIEIASDKEMIAAGETVQLEAAGADEYVWSPGKTLNDSTIAGPIASPLTTTTYVVTGSLTGACSATTTITIQVNGELVNVVVPVLFSPNGDAVNETLVIEGVESYPDCALNVFDKRGARVYGTLSYKNNWDGTVNGSPVPEGVYYYVFGCPNNKTVTGTVTVIR